MPSVSIFDVPDIILEIATCLIRQVEVYALARCNWLCYRTLQRLRAQHASLFLTKMLSFDTFVRSRGVAPSCRGLRVSLSAINVGLCHLRETQIFGSMNEEHRERDLSCLIALLDLLAENAVLKSFSSTMYTEGVHLWLSLNKSSNSIENLEMTIDEFSLVLTTSVLLGKPS